MSLTNLKAVAHARPHPRSMFRPRAYSGETQERCGRPAPARITLFDRIGDSRTAASLVLAVVRCADLTIVTVTGIAATTLSSRWASPTNYYASFPIIATMVALVSIWTYAHVFQTDGFVRACRRTGCVLASLVTGSVIGLAFCLMREGLAYEGCSWIGWWSASAALTALTLVGLTNPLTRLASDELVAPRIAVVGTNEYASAFINRIKTGSKSSAKFVGLYQTDREPKLHHYGDEPVLGDVVDLVERTRIARIDAIVLAFPSPDREAVSDLRAALGSVTSDVFLAVEMLELACKSSHTDRIASQCLIKIASRPLTVWQNAQKGSVNWLLAAFLLVAALPALALTAIAIKIDSPGPIFFRQIRLGFNNLPFNVIKFRTMFHDMADAHADRQTTRDDPRITPVGRFLRKTSIDELPQLLNVLRCEMSLVGPRPHALNTKAGDQLFHNVVAGYALRHRVKPGITGWAQINGWRGETRTIEQIEQRVAHDLHYIDNWSLLLDIKILALTALRELNSKVAF